MELNCIIFLYVKLHLTINNTFFGIKAALKAMGNCIALILFMLNKLKQNYRYTLHTKLYQDINYKAVLLICMAVNCGNSSIKTPEMAIILHLFLNKKAKWANLKTGNDCSMVAGSIPICHKNHWVMKINCVSKMLIYVLSSWVQCNVCSSLYHCWAVCNSVLYVKLCSKGTWDSPASYWPCIPWLPW